MTWILLNKRISLIIALFLCLLFSLGYANSLKGKLNKLEATHQAYIDNQDMLLAQAQADAARKEKDMAQKALEAERNYNVQIKQISADAVAAKSAANSLSKQLDKAKSRVPSASTKTIIEYVDTSSDVLEHCVAEYREVAKAADEHAADAKRLIEAWPE